jgi:hypothetical protein
MLKLMAGITRGCLGEQTLLSLAKAQQSTAEVGVHLGSELRQQRGSALCLEAAPAPPDWRMRHPSRVRRQPPLRIRPVQHPACCHPRAAPIARLFRTERNTECRLAGRVRTEPPLSGDSVRRSFGLRDRRLVSEIREQPVFDARSLDASHSQTSGLTAAREIVPRSKRVTVRAPLPFAWPTTAAGLT